MRGGLHEGVDTRSHESIQVTLGNSLHEEGTETSCQKLVPNCQQGKGIFQPQLGLQMTGELDILT